jgi:hypothetical protein
MGRTDTERNTYKEEKRIEKTSNKKGEPEVDIQQRGAMQAIDERNLKNQFTS